MVYLYEPDGTLNGEFTRDEAIRICKESPGWYWNEM
jgi:hypothetical protein